MSQQSSGNKPYQFCLNSSSLSSTDLASIDQFDGIPPDDLDKSMTISKGPKSCNGCSSSCSNKAVNVNHLNSCHTDTDNHTCPECALIFQTEDALDNHGVHSTSLLPSYTPEVGITKKNPFRCSECHSSFELFADLAEHVNCCHDPELFYPCEVRELAEDFPMPAPDLYQCQYCSLMFISRTYLMNHIEFTHKEPRMFKCYKCDLSLATHGLLAEHVASSHHCEPSQLHPSMMAPPEFHSLNSHSETNLQFNNHIQLHHGSGQYFACYLCSLFFLNLGDLDLHLKLYHENYNHLPGTPFAPLTYHEETPIDAEETPIDAQDLPDQLFECGVCRITFILQSDLTKHFLAEHDDPIPQFDGSEQELQRLCDNPPIKTRIANYSLNQTKQRDRIREDASLVDYDVKINNNDQNVTIKCSSGFYIQVARASFVTLEKKSVISHDNVAVLVDEVTVTKELSGLEATMLLHFSFSSGKDTLGGAAVHLHHSTRTIQIQGSFVMPDSTRAALWFLNNITLSRFKEIAKSKKFQVKNFNNAAKLLPTPGSVGTNPNPSDNSCQSCNAIFKTQAKPSLCGSCLKYFHKTCLKEHSKSCSSRPAHLSSPSFGASLPTSVQSVAAIPASVPRTSSAVPPTPSLTSTPSITGLQSSLLVVPTAQSGTMSAGSIAPQPRTSLTQPSTSSSVASLLSSSTSNQYLSSVSAPKKQNLKKKQKSVPINTAEHSIDILEKELSAAQAKIVTLDTQIKDKDQEREILWSRVRILEEKQNKEILDKYFPYQDNSSVKTNNASSAAPSPDNSSARSPQSPAATCPPAPSVQCPCTSSRRCAAQPPGCSHSCSSACRPMLFLPQLCSCQSPHLCQTQPLQQQSPNLSKKVEANSNEILMLKDLVYKLKHLPIQKNVIPESLPSSGSPKPSVVTDQQIRSTPEVRGAAPSSGTSQDASIASIEEFIFDSDPVTESAQLNCLDPTILL